jgi:hypothetical protein
MVVMNDFSDMLLDSVCHYYIEDFCIDVYEEIGLQFFLEVSLSGLGMSIILAS